MENASSFISAALDVNAHSFQEGNVYLKYIATRPRVERTSDHGLFGVADSISLSHAMDEVGQHGGNVWTIIWSLRREDAQRLGYDNASSWRQLVLSRQTEIAKAMKMPPDQLRWYAAFHDEGHHPHIHVMAWSADPKQGYLTRDGIKAMRSAMTNAIFQDELYTLYQQKDVSYKEVTAAARVKMATLVERMNTGICDSPSIAEKLAALSSSLESVSGRKVYGYLPKPVKAQVDTIVDELSQLPEVAEYYATWNQLRDELEGYYKEKPRQHLPLSQQREFKAIKNAVIQEAEKLQRKTFSFEDADMVDKTEADASAPQETTGTPGSVSHAAEEYRASSVAVCVTRLLHHVSRVFQETPLPANPKGVRIDSKRRKALLAKRLAMGHRLEDHEDVTLAHHLR